jgi:hypothetical protein
LCQLNRQFLANALGSTGNNGDAIFMGLHGVYPKG